MLRCGCDLLTDVIASMIIREMVERQLRTQGVLGSVRAPSFVASRATHKVPRRRPRMECGVMKRLLILLALSTSLASCDFPRPADVAGPGDDAGLGTDASTGGDASPASTACCVTADECGRIGASAPKPCTLGVCVHNECTPTTGICDGDEDCSGDTKFCVADTCAVCRVSASCPASTPVCDDTRHTCRACMKDRECDSGACDLAAGTCVDAAAILYASPSGTSADAVHGSRRARWLMRRRWSTLRTCTSHCSLGFIQAVRPLMEK